VAKRHADPDLILASDAASLLDVVDNVLNKGVVLSGDLTIALAQVDLIYARLSLLLCAADRVLPAAAGDFMEHHSRPPAARSRAMVPREGTALTIRRTRRRRRV
jgi:hypothetical protein